MINDIIENERYKNLVSSQIKEVLLYLLEVDQEFAVTANIKGVTFEPQLPEPITSQLAPFSLFVLSNYSFDSIAITKDSLQFEAGFGKENFGSVVTVPFYAIFQIIVDESILFVNPAATIESFFASADQRQRSMNAFKHNISNKKLFQ